MALGGSDGGDGLLIGPFLDWWDKRTAKRDAKRTARAERKARKHTTPTDSSPDESAVARPPDGSVATPERRGN